MKTLIEFWITWSITIAVGCVLVILIATHSRRNAKKIAFGVALLLTPIFFIWMISVVSGGQSTIWVNGAGTNGGISLPVEHYRSYATGGTYVFDPLVSDDQLWETVRSHYPDAEISDSTTRIFNDNQYFTITPTASSGRYELEAEEVPVWNGDDSSLIPFPSASVNWEEYNAKLNGQVPTSCDTTCLANYYHRFTNVTRDLDTFTMKLPIGAGSKSTSVATITYTGGKAIIKVS